MHQKDYKNFDNSKTKRADFVKSSLYLFKDFNCNVVTYSRPDPSADFFLNFGWLIKQFS